MSSPATPKSGFEGSVPEISLSYATERVTTLSNEIDSWMTLLVRAYVERAILQMQVDMYATARKPELMNGVIPRSAATFPKDAKEEKPPVGPTGPTGSATKENKERG